MVLLSSPVSHLPARLGVMTALLPTCHAGPWWSTGTNSQEGREEWPRLKEIECRVLVRLLGPFPQLPQRPIHLSAIISHIVFLVNCSQILDFAAQSSALGDPQFLTKALLLGTPYSSNSEQQQRPESHPISSCCYQDWASPSCPFGVRKTSLLYFQ